LWEDVAGRTGDIEMVRAFRKNMVFPEAANSAAAKQQWTQQNDIDAWLSSLVDADAAGAHFLSSVPILTVATAPSDTTSRTTTSTPV